MSSAAAGGSTDHGATERHYRRALLAYPKRWRDNHGEQLLGVLLDAAEDPAQERAHHVEIVDVVRHGVAERLSVLGRPFSGAVRNRLAALAIVNGVALAAVMLLTVGLGPQDRAGSSAPATGDGGAAAGSGLSAQQFDLMTPVYLGWLVVFGFAVARRPRPMRRSALLTAGCTAMVPVTAQVTGMQRPLLHQLAIFGVLALLAAAVDLYTEQVRPAVVVGLTAAVGYVAIAAIRTFADGNVGYAQVSDQLGGMSRPLGVGCLLLAALFAAIGRSSWSAPLLLVAIPWSAFGVWNAVTQPNSPDRPDQALLVALLAVGAALALIHQARTLQHRPGAYRFTST